MEIPYRITTLQDLLITIIKEAEDITLTEKDWLKRQQKLKTLVDKYTSIWQQLM